jgi:hypothetical protein
MIKEYGKTTLRMRKIIRAILIPLICSLVILLMLKLGLGLLGKPVLPLKTVQIFGNEHVSDREILALLGLNRDTSLLFLKIDYIEKLLMHERRINRTQMVKVYPDTLRIHIWEKKRGGLVIYGDDRYWLSKDGVILSHADGRIYSEFPLITLLSKDDDIKIGHLLQNVMVTNLLTAVGQFQPEYPDFSARIESFSVDDTGIWVWLDDASYRIYLGSRVDYEKLRRLRALIIVLESRDEESTYNPGWIDIDMSFTHAAVREGEREDELRR